MHSVARSVVKNVAVVPLVRLARDTNAYVSQTVMARPVETMVVAEAVANALTTAPAMLQASVQVVYPTVTGKSAEATDARERADQVAAWAKPAPTQASVYRTHAASPMMRLAAMCQRWKNVCVTPIQTAVQRLDHGIPSAFLPRP